MLKTIVAIVASTVVVFVWGFISWSIMPWHFPKDFKDGLVVAEVLKDQVPEPGVYAYPSWTRSPENTPEMMADKMKEGPFIWATVRPGPRPDLNMASSMAYQLLVVLLASVTMVFLIQKSRHDAFLDRLSIAVLAGLLLGIMSSLPARVFLESPSGQTLAYFLDGVIPWTLAGMVIAVILPKRGTA